MVHKIRTNKLYNMALELISHTQDESEIQKRDVTEAFFDEAYKSIEAEEITRNAFCGPVRKGKSTAAWAFCQKLVEYGKKCNRFSSDATFGLKNIARTQQEYDRMTRNPDVHDTVIMVDEFAEADETGQDITTIQAVRKQIADVHAGRHIHTIEISPKPRMDTISNLFLEVVQADKKKMITRCWLYYRLDKAGIEYRQLLGYVDIDVSDVLENWIGQGLETIFYKPDKTEAEIKKIEEWRKKDPYVEYVIKKFQKMELLTKEKVIRERDMYYAECVMICMEELRPLTKLRMLNEKIIESYKDIFTRKLDIPQSMFGSKILTDKIIGLVRLWETYHQINDELEKLDYEYFQKSKVTEFVYEKKKGELKSMREKISGIIAEMEGEYKRLSELKQKYQLIDSN